MKWLSEKWLVNSEAASNEDKKHKISKIIRQFLIIDIFVREIHWEDNAESN